MNPHLDFPQCAAIREPQHEVYQLDESEDSTSASETTLQDSTQFARQDTELEAILRDVPVACPHEFCDSSSQATCKSSEERETKTVILGQRLNSTRNHGESGPFPLLDHEDEGDLSLVYNPPTPPILASAQDSFSRPDLISFKENGEDSFECNKICEEVHTQDVAWPSNFFATITQSFTWDLEMKYNDPREAKQSECEKVAYKRPLDFVKESKRETKKRGLTFYKPMLGKRRAYPPSPPAAKIRRNLVTKSFDLVPIHQLRQVNSTDQQPSKEIYEREYKRRNTLHQRNLIRPRHADNFKVQGPRQNLKKLSSRALPARRIRIKQDVMDIKEQDSQFRSDINEVTTQIRELLSPTQTVLARPSFTRAIGVYEENVEVLREDIELVDCDEHLDKMTLIYFLCYTSFALLFLFWQYY